MDGTIEIRMQVSAVVTKLRRVCPVNRRSHSPIRESSVFQPIGDDQAFLRQVRLMKDIMHADHYARLHARQ